MIQVVMMYTTLAPNRSLDEEISRLAEINGGEFVSAGYTGGERDLVFKFPLLNDAVSQGFVQRTRTAYPFVRAEIRDVVPLNLAVSRKAIELLKEHEESAIALLGEIQQNARELSAKEALEILAALTLGYRDGIVLAWNGAIGALVAAMVGGDAQE